jgi:hypothetical protein
MNDVIHYIIIAEVIYFSLVSYTDSYSYFDISIGGNTIIFFKVTFICSMEHFNNEQCHILILVWKSPCDREEMPHEINIYEKSILTGENMYLSMLELKGTLKIKSKTFILQIRTET